MQKNGNKHIYSLSTLNVQFNEVMWEERSILLFKTYCIMFCLKKKHAMCKVHSIGSILVFHSEHSQHRDTNIRNQDHHTLSGTSVILLSFNIINDLEFVHKLRVNWIKLLISAGLLCVCSLLLWGFSQEPVNVSTTISIFTEKLLLKLIALAEINTFSVKKHLHKSPWSTARENRRQGCSQMLISEGDVIAQRFLFHRSGDLRSLNTHISLEKSSVIQ